MKIFNRKARYNYRLLERLEAGIELKGAEVKAIKQGNVNISSSYAKVIDGEIYLVNALVNIPGAKDYDPSRTRKLLLHKKQILDISTKIKAKKLTIVPTKLYTKQRLVKVELALAKAKRTFEKKETKKKQDIKREIDRALKDR